MEKSVKEPGWNVSCNSRNGMAHWWERSPLKPEYVRSHCGKVEKSEDLQGLSHELRRCKVCAKHGGEKA